MTNCDEVLLWSANVYFICKSSTFSPAQQLLAYKKYYVPSNISHFAGEHKYHIHEALKFLNFLAAKES